MRPVPERGRDTRPGAGEADAKSGAQFGAVTCHDDARPSSSRCRRWHGQSIGARVAIYLREVIHGRSGRDTRSRPALLSFWGRERIVDRYAKERQRYMTAALRALARQSHRTNGARRVLERNLRFLWRSELRTKQSTRRGHRLVANPCGAARAGRRIPSIDRDEGVRRLRGAEKCLRFELEACCAVIGHGELRCANSVSDVDPSSARFLGAETDKSGRRIQHRRRNRAAAYVTQKALSAHRGVVDFRRCGGRPLASAGSIDGGKRRAEGRETEEGKDLSCRTDARFPPSRVASESRRRASGVKGSRVERGTSS